MKIMFMFVALGIIIAAFSASCESRTPLSEVADISMKIGNLNPVEVGILTPSNKFILLKSEEFVCQGVVVKDEVLSIDPSRATGYYWSPQGGRDEVVVFSEVGSYTIYVADNLETEIENSASITKQYTNKRKHGFTALGSCRDL
ncbi:MAG: hypothetical protein LCH59_11425 [Proteobacteria bacterium]|nr:hypothetical protein [Pseudomonadota bacterium]